MPNTTTPATDLNDLSSCSGVITAADFSDYVTDSDRNEWTPGKMRHVIAAVGDRRVAITTDRRTGSTLVNVRLVCVTTGSASNYPRVQVEYVYAPGLSQFTNYLLFNLGPVITVMPSAVPGDDRGKWTAMRTWGDEVSAAAQIAHNRRVAEGLTTGCTIREIKPGASEVVVSYAPDHAKITARGESRLNRDNRFWYTRISLADIAAELDRRAQVDADYAARAERERAGVPDACEV